MDSCGRLALGFVVCAVGGGVAADAPQARVTTVSISSATPLLCVNNLYLFLPVLHG